ncbi:MAG: hypothetical protein BGO49_22055 [Planctomycetales bacterium 71-10]|nr:MAG: hypothetical protein BGO49_22055 [Planctomycetales bacterium 71-10]
MVTTLRRIGDGWSITLDDQSLKDLGWDGDRPLKVEKTPDGRGLILAPATEEEAEPARLARIREIGTALTDRHESVLRKLAE